MSGERTNMRYFDYAATTPIAGEAADEMNYWLRCNNANAAYALGSFIIDR